MDRIGLNIRDMQSNSFYQEINNNFKIYIFLNKGKKFSVFEHTSIQVSSVDKGSWRGHVGHMGHVHGFRVPCSSLVA